MQYILVDDTFTSGDTLISAYEHIISQGGTVAAMTTLASSSSQNYLAARPQDIAKLFDKTGLNADSFRREIGFPIEQLTGAEIFRFAHRSKGLDSGASLRSRIFESRSEADSSGGTSGTGTAGNASQVSYSLSPSAMAGGVQMHAVGMIRNPLKRAKAFQRLSNKLQDLRISFERLELMAGAKRRKSSLKKEGAMREAIRTAELVEDAMKRYEAAFSNEDLTKLKAMPVHEYLADPDSHLRGRLMSKRQAIARHPDMFQVNRPGEYDGADGISRAVFGGALMPDQAAQELYSVGLIKYPTADAMWDEIKKEQSHIDNSTLLS